jgi:hypothetical protein
MPNILLTYCIIFIYIVWYSMYFYVFHAKIEKGNVWRLDQ